MFTALFIVQHIMSLVSYSEASMHLQEISANGYGI